MARKSEIGIGDAHPLDEVESVLDEWPEIMPETPEAIETAEEPEGSPGDPVSGAETGSGAVGRRDAAASLSESGWPGGGRERGARSAAEADWSAPLMEAFAGEMKDAPPVLAEYPHMAGVPDAEQSAQQAPFPERPSGTEAANGNAAFFARAARSTGMKREGARSSEMSWTRDGAESAADRADAESAMDGAERGAEDGAVGGAADSASGGGQRPIQVEIHVESPVFEVRGEGDVMGALQSKAGELAELVAAALAERMRDVLSNMTGGGE